MRAVGITLSQFDHHSRGKISGHWRARHGVAYRPSKSGHSGITAAIRPSKMWHKMTRCDAHYVAKMALQGAQPCAPTEEKMTVTSALDFLVTIDR